MAPEFNFIIRPEDNALVENVKTRASANRQALNDRQQTAKLERVVRTKSEENKTITKKGVLRSRQAQAEEEEIAVAPKKRVGFGVWSGNWYVERIYVPPSDPLSGYFYLPEKSIEIGFSSTPSGSILTQYSEEQGPFTITSNGESAIVAGPYISEGLPAENDYVNGQDVVEPRYPLLRVDDYNIFRQPVRSSYNGISFGVQLIIIPVAPGEVEPNWPHEFRQYYISYRYNTRTKNLQVKTGNWVNTYLKPSGFEAAARDVYEGGDVWRERYAAMAFSDDPSLAVRNAGYYGDYHITRKAGRRYANILTYSTAALREYYGRDPYRPFNRRQHDTRDMEFYWAQAPITSSTTAGLVTELNALYDDNYRRDGLINSAGIPVEPFEFFVPCVSNVLSTQLKDTITNHWNEIENQAEVGFLYPPSRPAVYPMLAVP